MGGCFEAPGWDTGTEKERWYVELKNAPVKVQIRTR